MPDFGPVKYMRRTYDNINDYPPPQNGEHITEWIDRMHDNNISVNKIDILDWFWHSVAINLNYEDKEELLARLPDIKFFSWGGRVYVSSDEDIMMLKLSAGDHVIHTPRAPTRLKDGT